MALVAVCPTCHVENLVSNSACDICGTALGATIVQTDTGANTKWIAYSAATTLGIYILCYVLGIHQIYLLLAAFYGALITSYVCKNNVVFETSIGALVGIFLSLMFLVVAKPPLLKAFAAGLSRTSSGGAVLILIAFIVILPAIYPVCLMGASAGETLNQRRRGKRPTEVEQL